MKKRVNKFLISVLILLSISFVSAAHCDIIERNACTTNIIMGVSGLTNAHGEFPDSGTYNYVLCCDFGYGDTTCSLDLTPQGNPINKIIGLSAATNAHAEIPSQTSFPVDVCYEDLVCVSLDTSVAGDCNLSTGGDYPIDIFSLSSYTNAHIGTLKTYPEVSICCTSDAYNIPACSLTNAYWSLDGETAINGDETVLADQDVYLVAEGTNCYGQTVSFEVFENDEGAAIVQPNSQTFGTNGVWETEWIDDGLLQGNPEYYFIATIVGSSPPESVETKIDLEVSSKSTIDYCSENGIATCGSYPDEENCVSDICDVAGSSGDFCDIFECSCSWDGSNGCSVIYSSSGECGDGIIDEGEQCEYDSDIQQTCASFGLGTGTLTCVNCMIDVSGCSEATEGICGDNEINIGETCDGGVGGLTCLDFDSFSGGDLGCDSTCQIDTSLCTGGVENGGTCSITQTIASECDEEPVGLFIYSWEGVWTGVQSGTAYLQCIAGGESETIECPAQVQLSFFNIYNAILTIALIVLVYFFLIRKKKNKRKKSSKRRKKK